MDALTNILQAPVNTILVLAGIALVFFTFFELSKGSVRMRKSQTKTSMIPAAIGAVLILGGVFYRAPAAATPAEPTVNPAAFAEVPTIEPSATTAPTDIPTSTVAPTETLPPSPTASPVPVRTIGENCIASQTWKVDSAPPEKLSTVSEKDNCLSVGSLGITASGGLLHLVVPPPDDSIAAGIYTEVSDQAVIKFNVSVQELYIVSPGSSAYVSFAIAPQSDVMTKSGSGRFKLQVNDVGNGAFVHFVPADVGEPNGIKLNSMHYVYGLSYDVRLVLNDLLMTIYINEGKRPVETVKIPAGPKVFYIGYNVPYKTSLTATIKNVIVDEVEK